MTRTQFGLFLRVVTLRIELIGLPTFNSGMILEFVNFIAQSRSSDDGPRSAQVPE